MHVMQQIGVNSASNTAAELLFDHDHDLVTGLCGPVYDEACRLWNGAVHARPGLVVRCRHARDVTAALHAARDTGLPVSVRGGGFDWAGRALVDGGLLIDVSHMRGIEIDADVATIGGGVTCGALLDAAAARGMSTATARIAEIGYAGQALSGGNGRVASALGLAADNLLGAEVVLADGEVVWTDEDHEPDLFWALRGAGGNFGVVTRMRVRLHPLTHVLAGAITFPWQYAPRVVDGWIQITAEDRDELTLSLGVVRRHGEPLIVVSPTWTGDDFDVGRRLIGRLRRLGDPIEDRTRVVTVAQSTKFGLVVTPSRQRYTVGTRNLAALSERAAARLLAAGERMPDGPSAISVLPVHGAATRVDPQRTAVGLREPHLVMLVLAGWDGSGAGSHARDWENDTVTAMDPFSMSGANTSLMGPHDVRRATDAYGANGRRLLALKRRYDPGEAFQATPMPDRGLVAG